MFLSVKINNLIGALMVVQVLVGLFSDKCYGNSNLRDKVTEKRDHAV